MDSGGEAETMVGYFFWVIFTNKISKNSHYYRTGGKLLIHTFSLKLLGVSSFALVLALKRGKISPLVGCSTLQNG